MLQMYSRIDNLFIASTAMTERVCSAQRTVKHMSCEIDGDKSDQKSRTIFKKSNNFFFVEFNLVTVIFFKIVQS